MAEAPANTGYPNFNELLEGLRGVVGASQVHDAPWEKITTSLLGITKMLTAWGRTMRRTRKRPDSDTLNEITRSVDELDDELDNLDIWIAKRSENYWELFRLSIIQARKVWTIEKREALSTYFHEVSKTTSSDKKRRLSKTLELRRFTAGDGLVEYADALREAVESAVAVRKAEEQDGQQKQ